jgi:hypothetical protein
MTQNVLRPTTTVVTSNRVAGATFGQNITFTAAVTPTTGTGVPTGTVQFAIDTVNVGGPITLNALGRATFTTNTVPAGSHSVVATYSGSAVFAGGANTGFTQLVNKAASTTVVTSNVNPSVFGRAVTFTARVTPAAATGSVTFTVDGSPFGGAVVLDATGRARLVISSLTVGSHTVVATYGGSTNYNPSTSATFTETVNKAASATVVSTSGSPANVGTTVVFTATVTAVAPGAGLATGTVQFLIDGLPVGGPVALGPTGRATYSTSTLTIGLHTASAVYSGDGNFNTSTSANRNQRIR